MRRKLVIALAVFLTTFAVIYSGEIIDRKAYDRAFMAWLHNPTPETEANLRAEQHKTEIIRITDATIVGAAAVALTYGVSQGIAFLRKNASNPLKSR